MSRAVSVKIERENSNQEEQPVLELVKIEECGWPNIRGKSLLRILNDLSPSRIIFQNVCVCAGHIALTFAVKREINGARTEDKDILPVYNNVYTVLFDTVEPSTDLGNSSQQKERPSPKALGRFVNTLLKGQLEMRYLHGMLATSHSHALVGSSFFLVPEREATRDHPEECSRTALILATTEIDGSTKLWQWKEKSSAWSFLNKFYLLKQPCEKEVLQVAFCMSSFPRRVVWVEKDAPAAGMGEQFQQSFYSGADKTSRSKGPVLSQKVVARSIEFQLFDPDDEDDEDEGPSHTYLLSNDIRHKKLRIGAAVILLSEKGSRVLAGQGGVWIITADQKVFFHDFCASRLSGLQDPAKGEDLWGGGIARYVVHDITGQLCVCSAAHEMAVVLITPTENGLAAKSISNLSIPTSEDNGGTLQLRGFTVHQNLAMILTTKQAPAVDAGCSAKDAEAQVYNSASCLLFDLFTGLFIEKHPIKLTEPKRASGKGFVIKGHPNFLLSFWRGSPCSSPLFTDSSSSEGSSSIGGVGVMTAGELRWLKYPAAVDWVTKTVKKIAQKNPKASLHNLALRLAQGLGEMSHPLEATLGAKAIFEVLSKQGRVSSLDAKLLQQVPLAYLLAFNCLEELKETSLPIESKLKELLEVTSMVKSKLADIPKPTKPKLLHDDVKQETANHVSTLLRTVKPVDLIFEPEIRDWCTDASDLAHQMPLVAEETIPSLKELSYQNKTSRLAFAAACLCLQDSSKAPLEIRELIEGEGELKVDPHLVFLCSTSLLNDSENEANTAGTSSFVFDVTCQLLYKFNPQRLHPFVSYIERYTREWVTSRQDIPETKMESTKKESSPPVSSLTLQKHFFHRALLRCGHKPGSEDQENAQLLLLMELEQLEEVALRLLKKKRWGPAEKLLHILKERSLGTHNTKTSIAHWTKVFLIFITSCILENHKSFAGIILQNYSPPSITVNQVIDTIKEHSKKNENGKRFVPVETLKFVLLQMLENKEFD